MKIIIILFFIELINGLFVEKYTITNSKQHKYKSFIENDNLPLVIVSGAAGTGKTMIACHNAIKLFNEGKYKKIIITRPSITVEENLGFLPGNLEDKMYPFLIPIYDYFLEYYTKDNIHNLINTNKLEIAPLSFMRGRTFKDSIIIADEMQNSSINQMKMLLSRIGLNSKMIITGDINQSDIPCDNGLNNLINQLTYKYENYYDMINDGFGYIHFDNNCIQRH
jgi:phosphate starvation-inducible PhoH-like protein